MDTSLGPGDVGIDRPFPEAAALAADAGFDAIQVDLGYLADHGPDEYRAVLDEHGLRTGSVDLPVAVTGDEAEYEADVDALAGVASDLAAIGCDCATHFVWSFSDERDFEDNFRFHRRRLGRPAEILADHGLELGLEFLGPETLREGHEHEFIYTAEGMLELCDAINSDTVGLQLDSWHWYTAGGSIDALESLERGDVVDVHLNDAPAGIPRDEQIDTERRLPAETGVIDVAAFLGHLDRIGYEGAVTAEPFSDDLEAMDDAAAAERTMESLETAFERAGL
ncbi:sugar phosphate isomerase/epimerase family protein [Halomicrobium salinisoli]|uniref:sugar phosphate isomerase/epimerase family protein n=1 Tax=Halomicrobium salinisoli TaxID=2878391 RepID=UPI001CF01BDB|nr:sugar phosphate isomerase/epimerase family protein [Halomicrobium salinisoli]